MHGYKLQARFCPGNGHSRIAKEIQENKAVKRTVAKVKGQILKLYCKIEGYYRWVLWEWQNTESSVFCPSGSTLAVN
jgi:hypothetical protein